MRLKSFSAHGLWYMGLVVAFIAIATMGRPLSSLPILLVLFYAVDALFFRHGIRRFAMPAAGSQLTHGEEKLAILPIGVMAVLAVVALGYVVSTVWVPVIQAKDIVNKLPSLAASTKAAVKEDQQAALHEALAGLSAGDLERIEKVADKLSPELSVLAHYNLGIVAYQKNALDEAFNHLSKAVALDNTLADAHYNIGRIHQRREDYAKAIDSFKQAEHYGGESGDTKYCLSVFHWQLGRISEAISAAQRASELFPANSPWRQKCQLLLGQIRKNSK